MTLPEDGLAACRPRSQPKTMTLCSRERSHAVMPPVTRAGSYPLRLCYRIYPGGVPHPHAVSVIQLGTDLRCRPHREGPVCSF